MRRIIPILFLLIFVSGALAQAPSLPHRVYGNVTSGGVGTGCLGVEFRKDGDILASDVTEEDSGFYDVNIPSGSGDFVYLFVEGSNSSQYVNFSAGSSTVLNHAGSYSGCSDDGGGTTTVSADFTTSITDYTVNVDASGSSGADIYEWDWNNNGSVDATGVTASHTYNSSGDYTIELNVESGDGGTDTTTRTVSVPQEDEDPDSGGGTGGSDGDDGSTGGSSPPGGGGLPGGLGPGGEEEDPDELVVSGELSGEGSTSVNIDSVEQDQPVQVNVDGDSSISGVSFTSGASAEKVTVEISSSGSAPEGVDELAAGPAYRYYSVDLQNVESFRDGVVGFQVSKSWLNSQNRSANDVVFESYDGFSWHSLDTSVVGESIGSYSFESETSTMGTFAAGVSEEQEIVERPSIQVTGFDVTSEGESEVDVNVQSTVQNRGNAAGEKTLFLSRDSEVVGNRTVSLSPGETTTLSFELTLTEQGVHTLSMGSYQEDVEVKSSSSMLLVFAGAGVVAVITILIGIIYYRETKRANELEEKIRNIENQGNQGMQNLQRNLNNVQKSIRGGNQQNQRQQGGQRRGQQNRNQGQNQRNPNNQGQGRGNQNNGNQANSGQNTGNQQGNMDYGDRRDDGR